jgi:FkbM family methyltransferase
MFFAQAVSASGTVVSFEPVPALFEDLKSNVSLNSLRNVRCICSAVSDRTGEELFAFDPALDTQGKLAACEPAYTNPAAASVCVATLCLDAVVGSQLPPPHFLKIDVEGGAGRVLQGAKRVLQIFRPEIYIELHGPEEQAAVRDYIQQAGYTLLTLNGEPVSDPTSGWYSPLSCRPILSD